MVLLMLMLLDMLLPLEEVAAAPDPLLPPAGSPYEAWHSCLGHAPGAQFSPPSKQGVLCSVQVPGVAQPQDDSILSALLQKIGRAHV